MAAREASKGMPRLWNTPYQDLKKTLLRTGFATILIAALLISGVGVGRVRAASPIYVRTDGDDVACTGEVDAPYTGGGYPQACAKATINVGHSTVDDSGTLYIRSGTYTESFTITVGKTLWIVGDGVGNTVWDGGDTLIPLRVNALGWVHLSGVTIQNGSSASHGGGLINEGTLTLVDSEVKDNNAATTGGGIRNMGTLALTTSTVSGNVAATGSGGGIDNVGTLTIQDSTISDNHADDLSASGGGILNSNPAGQITDIDRTTISGNSAGDLGGGVMLQGTGATNIRNSTITGNTSANNDGGGIAVSGGGLIIRGGTVARNHAGGSHAGGIAAFTTVSFYDTIVAGNDNAQCMTIDPIHLDSYDHNLSSDTSCGFTEPSDMQGVDPLLGDLQDNGGPTQTMALLAGSPAIDHGSNATCTSPAQRGGMRFLDGDGDTTATCDIGAYERNAPIFNDVAWDDWARDYIEGIYNAGITSGCGGGNYCPVMAVSRAQMAKFLLVAEHGSGYTPPTGTGTMFGDVPPGHLFVDWIEQLANEGITSGCGGGNYCPDLPVSRAQMAKFLLIAEHGTGYTPPAGTGTMFLDVGPGHLFVDWIEQLASEGVTSGCGGGNYCPDYSVARDQMAVFLVRTFDLLIP
jgi:hypothetical protein